MRMFSACVYVELAVHLSTELVLRKHAADSMFYDPDRFFAKSVASLLVSVAADVSSVVENVMPSIVSITNMSVQEVQNFFGGTSKQESESAGTGIIISQNDSELLVVTNNHVVAGSNTLTVTFADGNSCLLYTSDAADE